MIFLCLLLSLTHTEKGRSVALVKQLPYEQEVKTSTGGRPLKRGNTLSW